MSGNFLNGACIFNTSFLSLEITMNDTFSCHAMPTALLWPMDSTYDGSSGQANLHYSGFKKCGNGTRSREVRLIDVVFCLPKYINNKINHSQ
jgi:hypothetical protein